VPPAVLAEVVRRVHAAGRRVAVHSTHGQSAAAAVAAGADSLEHGMHLAADLLDTTARQGTALVPTMLALAHLPELLAKDPPPEPLRSWLADGWARHPDLVRAAYQAGVRCSPAPTAPVASGRRTAGSRRRFAGWPGPGCRRPRRWAAGPGPPGGGLGCLGWRKARRPMWWRTPPIHAKTLECWSSRYG
jgi:hypothetical protein